MKNEIMTFNEYSEITSLATRELENAANCNDSVKLVASQYVRGMIEVLRVVNKKWGQELNNILSSHIDAWAVSG